MISRLVPGTSALCRIVRLIGEGWTGEGCGCALSDSTIPNVIRAVQSTIRLNMVPFLLEDGLYLKGTDAGRAPASRYADLYIRPKGENDREPDQSHGHLG